MKQSARNLNFKFIPDETALQTDKMLIAIVGKNVVAMEAEIDIEIIDIVTEID